VLLGYIVLAAYEARHHEMTPPLDGRSGAWVILWLAGLAVISWIGSYPVASAHAGNLGLLGFGQALPVLAVFSALILWMATAWRLPDDRVAAYLRDEG
jgi:hypothetical protein